MLMLKLIPNVKLSTNNCETVKIISFDGFSSVLFSLTPHRSHRQADKEDKNTLNLDQARYPQLFFFQNLVE